MDPNAVLGVDQFATDAEIIRAFRRLALLHHPDRNAGSTASAQRFREVKAAYDALRGRPRNTRRAHSEPAPATSSGFAHPGEHARTVGVPAVAQVVARLSKLNDVIRAALGEPTRARVDAVIDAARWARLDVDSALALKGHVADLRDAHWGRLRFTGRQPALATFAAFLETNNGKWDLIALRNLRERLEGLLNVARGLANDLG